MSIPATPAEGAALLILALFLILSAASQVRTPVENRLRTLDLFNWLPFWNFFAPRPGTLDFHLLYRDQLPDGVLTSWREIPLGQQRRWHDFLWNPRRRLKKALFDAAGGIKRKSAREDGPDVRITVPYLLLLTYVSGLPRIYPAVKTQFLVMASTPAAAESEPVVLLYSDLHPR